MSQLESNQSYVIVTDKNTLTQILKSLLTVGQKEVTLNLENEGIHFRSMDKDHVSLLDMGLSENIFERYGIKEKIQISFNVKSFLDIIKSLDKKQSIKLDIESEKIILTQKESIYSIPLLNIADFNDCPLPYLSYDSMIKMNGKTLKNIIKKASTVSDYITITSNDSCIVLDSKGDNGSYHELIPKELLIELRIREDSQTTYSIEYLKQFASSLLNDDEIILSYSSRKPCRLEKNINNLGRVHYYLAPRVEN